MSCLTFDHVYSCFIFQFEERSPRLLLPQALAARNICGVTCQKVISYNKTIYNFVNFLASFVTFLQFCQITQFIFTNKIDDGHLFVGI
jgi:hypothetical protein